MEKKTCNVWEAKRELGEVAHQRDLLLGEAGPPSLARDSSCALRCFAYTCTTSSVILLQEFPWIRDFPV